MTYQQPGNNGYDNEMPPARIGLAVASMILGILGVITACVGVGLLLGLVGLILGAVALMRVNRDPLSHGGKGFAIAGISTGGFAMLLAIPLAIFVLATGASSSILLPSLGRARELSNRSYCAANLRGLTQSMIVYATENNDVFPVTAPPASALQYNVFSTTPSGISADQTLATMYGSDGVRGDVTGSLWILVLKQQTTPKQYLCKSDIHANATPAPVENAGSFYSNFTGGSGVISYSIAYPWIDGTHLRGSRGAVVAPWWKNMTDASLPLLADMAPLQGTGVPRTDVQTSGPGVSAKIQNSRNHGGDGQVVAYGDAHAAFERVPQVGQNQDNIWTSWRNGAMSNGGVAPGTRPGHLGEAVSTGGTPLDIVMVPVRNADTGEVQ